MQSTDESGRAYGEDPYGGAGHAYAHGYAYSGMTTTDTVAMPRDPGQRAQGTHPKGDACAAETDPYATRTHLHADGPGPARTAWEGLHGDVLTVPHPGLDATGPSAPGPVAPKGESVRPVFVDATGRRQRRVLRVAQLLVIPAGGYVALLISTLLGGPTLSAPFVPQPDSTHPTTPHASAPDASPGTGHSAGSVRPAAAQKNPRSTTAQRTPGSTERPTASSAAAPVPAAAPTGVASATSASVSAPTAAPTRTAAAPTSHPSSKGRALGASHKPVK
ncbi:hypothetical protein [Streptomyces sp. NPDC002573]|uniref:hypothetical protein n=1 Tax=Streptomyces sp. NPDC002573 TaxID=3364651 RepID=UPI003678E159